MRRRRSALRGSRLALPAAAGPQAGGGSLLERTDWTGRGIGGSIPRLPSWCETSRRGGSRRKRGWPRSPPLLGRPSGDRPKRLALAFRGLLEETDRERADLIERLKQIGRRQRELAELVGRLASELEFDPARSCGRSRRQADRPAAAARFHCAQFRGDPAHDPLCLRGAGRAGCAARGVGAGIARAGFGREIDPGLRALAL